LAAGPVFRQPKYLLAIFEALRKICMQVGRDFAMPALRLGHAGDSDKFFAYSRISSV
jgi:hypothetical protein